MFLQEYEKIRMIGKGAFASVFKVRHAKLGYVRALKVCDSFIEDENDRAWQTFLSECKVLLRIGNGSHPNIVKIFQPRLIDNHAVVEMDCVEGDPLHSYIKQNQFVPIEEFYRFAKQIISALAYCHVDVYKFLMNPVDDKLEIDPNDGRKYIVSPEKEKELIKKYGVVHNDLHSGNIIRKDYDGQYILLDFGLAIQDSHCVKSSSRFDGAIEYCSPEKLENGTISTQSDVYALGILLYEMLTGRVPFPYSNGDGSTPESARSRVYLQHLQDTPPSIFELRKQAFEATHLGEIYTQDYSDQLEAIIMKCLAKKPEERFKNAKKLYNAFEKCFDSSNRTKETSSESILNETPAYVKAMMEELRTLKQEIESIRTESIHDVSQNNKRSIDETINTQSTDVNASNTKHKVLNWLHTDLNWLWCLILCTTVITCGSSAFNYVLKGYDLEGFVASCATCVGVSCVILLWLFKFKSKTLISFIVFLWIIANTCSFIMHSAFIRLFTLPAGLCLLGLCLAIYFNRKKQ